MSKIRDLITKLANARYFVIEELKCNCCGECKVNPESFYRLYKARVLARIPFYLNSAWRCKKHNKEVGSETKNHVKGYAFDIRCDTSWERIVIIVACVLAGFRRIGIPKTFIHVDDADLPPALWIGDEDHM